MPAKPNEFDQHARFLETARALGCDQSDAAFDDKLKAVLTSAKLTDAQVLDALDASLRLGGKHAARSRETIAESKALLVELDKAIK